MGIRTHITGFLLLLAIPFYSSGQRVYAPHSVLSTGNWYKLSVGSAGIYKIDVPLLNAMGVNTASLSSASVRLFGNGGQMLPEANATPRPDDLVENSLFIADGGDGLINGSDYILFYAPGPDGWAKDSLNQLFRHQKNIYSDKAFYYLTVGGNGLRVATAPATGPSTVTVNSFSDRYFHELDTVNFLSSGKEWYGEELSAIPGRSLSRSFTVSVPNALNGSSFLLRSNCAARSVGVASRFDVQVNNQPASQLLINSVSGGQYDLFGQQNTGNATGITAGSNFTVSYTYTPGGFNSQGWINWFELFTRRSLSMNGTDQLLFRDWPSTGPGNRAGFVISNATAATAVWDITDPLHPVQQQSTLAGTELRFTNDAARLREYIAFNTGGLLVPASPGKINNQDLHAAAPADMIIVTASVLQSQAVRLAQLHQQMHGMRVKVVTADEVYNEFSSGIPDPSAIRDFVKMYYDRYHNNAADRLKYLLLFGDASFDYKDRITGNTNMVPAWENDFSLDVLSTCASDDFYGFLDDNEDINSGLVLNLLDIGIGRVPAKNNAEAKNFVDKVQTYLSPAALGPWRNSITFIADDEDNNLHLQDAESMAATTTSVNPVFNQQKIYLDAYQQESGPGGSHYPQANQAINNQVFNGTLIWNFNGHGGSGRLADETILDQDIVNSWNNPVRLPLFITATCDFAPYDNPLINSIGENILLRPQTGGIALMTTTRVVFAFSNRVLNNNYLQIALQPDAGGKYKTLGDAVKEAKNFTYQNSADITNNRKFTLLGDPALTLAFPKPGIRITRVNNIPAALADTLSAGETATIEGEIINAAGTVQTGFNGNLYPAVFDKPQTVNTLGNDPGSPVTSFQAQSSLLFKGKSSVVGGRFTFTFKVPKDINYSYANGRLSLYAENGSTDVNAVFGNFMIGGAGTGAGNDHTGPQIKLFLNDELFVNGGITNQRPVLIAKLADTSGINITGNGIGHDIIATLDNDSHRYFVLNDFFQGDLNSYQQGVVRFQLPELAAGAHTLKLKAWDVLNNSNEATIDFVVANDDQLELSHVLNYPNPFTTRTVFMFEHNKPGLPLSVALEIMTITGRVIKTISGNYITEGNRVTGIEWDGRDDFGDRLGRGVYIYRITVSAPGVKKALKMEKLVIL